MKRYNYYKAVADDIIHYIFCNYTEEEITSFLDNRYEWENDLYNRLWIEDSVTGNASGTYFFNRYKAEEALCHNLGLLADAMEEFDCNYKDLSNGAEWADVTIRCYLLGYGINAALDELEERYGKR